MPAERLKFYCISIEAIQDFIGEFSSYLVNKEMTIEKLE